MEVRLAERDVISNQRHLAVDQELERAERLALPHQKAPFVEALFDQITRDPLITAAGSSAATGIERR